MSRQTQRQTGMSRKDVVLCGPGVASRPMFYGVRFLYLVVFSNANGSAVCKIKNKHQFSKIVLTLNR